MVNYNLENLLSHIVAGELEIGRVCEQQEP